MAIPFARMQKLGLSENPPVLRAAYVLRLRHRRRRTGVLVDHSGRSDLISSELLLPAGAERWCDQPMTFFEALEAQARRANAVLGIELVVALPGPDEASPAECAGIVRRFAMQHLVGPHGLGVVCALHNPDGDPQMNVAAGDTTAELDGDAEIAVAANFHAHLVAGLHAVHAHGFGPRADDLLPVRRGAATLDGVNWTRLWGEHLDWEAARLGRSWRVRRTAPFAGRHVGPAAARRAISLNLRKGGDGRLNSLIEARNREAVRDPARLLDALGSRPFTHHDVARMIGRYSELDRREQEDLAECVLLWPDCVQLADPDAGPTVWHTSVDTIFAEEEAIAAAMRLVGARPIVASWPPPEDQPLVVVRPGRAFSATDLRAALLSGPDGPRRNLVALGFGEGTLAPWHRAGCTLLDLKCLPRVVPARGSLLVLDGAEYASPGALLDALQLAEAAACRIILARRSDAAAPLLDRIARCCGEIVFRSVERTGLTAGFSGATGDWRSALVVGQMSQALRALAAEGRVHFAPDLAEARRLALELCARDSAALLDRAFFSKVARERDHFDANVGELDGASADRHGGRSLDLSGAVVLLHDPTSPAPLLPLAHGAERLALVADGSRTPDLDALLRQVECGLGPRNACALAPRDNYGLNHERAGDFSIWCRIERALLRRRAAGLPDAWPGRGARILRPLGTMELSLTSAERDTLEREDLAFGALWRGAEEEAGPRPQDAQVLPAREAVPAAKSPTVATLDAAATSEYALAFPKPLRVAMFPTRSLDDAEPSGLHDDPDLGQGEPVDPLRRGPGGAAGEPREAERERAEPRASGEEVSDEEPAFCEAASEHDEAPDPKASGEVGADEAELFEAAWGEEEFASLEPEWRAEAADAETLADEDEPDGGFVDGSEQAEPDEPSPEEDAEDLDREL